MIPEHNKQYILADIIVQVSAKSIDQTFTYLISERYESTVYVGSRVVIPFGPRKVQGYVIQIRTDTLSEPMHKMKEIESVLDERPPLTPELIQLAKWMSEEYVCLHIQAISAMLPSVLKSKTIKNVQMSKDGHKTTTYEVKDNVTTKTMIMIQLDATTQEIDSALQNWSKRALKQQMALQYIRNAFDFQDVGDSFYLLPLKEVLIECETSRSVIDALQEKGFISMIEQEVPRDPYAGKLFTPSHPLVFTDEQQQAYQHIIDQSDQGEHQTFLLHGVTGSGKTEIYLQSIDHILQKGLEAIVLVPEISLTPQMVERFKSRFGAEVAVLHSRLSAGERYDEWRKIQAKKAKVVIGARSALFAPFEHLGLIIVDEEHEGSYKQDESPRYHARDVAIFRGEFHKIPVILGTATPTLESYARALKGVYTLLALENRVLGQNMPAVQIVDMREELRSGNRSMFCQELHVAIQERLERDEQIVLLLNRRGFSTFVMCRDCGYVLNCPHCEISLTYHKTSASYRCHYCGHSESGTIELCPSCSSKHIRFFGTGTQKVEEALYQTFPNIRVIRMDVDTTGKKGSHEKLLSAFGKGEADCLLGTQMIAKGLDFKRVTLVGVLAADAMLHLPDFRSAERTFQLLTQVSGRAGRHHLPGEVVVQTYAPEHYSIVHAAKHDFAAFYKQEMLYRQQRGYPPYLFVTLMTFAHEDVKLVMQTAQRSVDYLKGKLTKTSVLLGPVASPIPRIKDRYRYHCMIKYKNEPKLGSILQALLDHLHADMHKHNMHITVDRNPQMFM